MEPLKAKGNQIVEAHSEKVVRLRGANAIRFVWNQTAEVLNDDLAAVRVLIRDWKANCATLWVHSAPVLAGDILYLRYLDEMVGTLAQEGAYALLSWHADTPGEWHPTHITQAGITAMGIIARRYRETSNVFYACQAEPGDGGQPGAQLSWDALKPYQEATIDAIRFEDSLALIGVAGNSWSQDVQGMLRNPIVRGNIFAKVHLYEGRNSDPPTTMEMTILRSGAQGVHQADICPVVVGECGVGSRSNAQDFATLIARAESGWGGWQAWNYSTEGKPFMLTDMDPVVTNPYGELVRQTLQRYGTPPVPPPGPQDPSGPVIKEILERLDALEAGQKALTLRVGALEGWGRSFPGPFA